MNHYLKIFHNVYILCLITPAFSNRGGDGRCCWCESGCRFSCGDGSSCSSSITTATTIIATSSCASSIVNAKITIPTKTLTTIVTQDNGSGRWKR